MPELRFAITAAEVFSQTCPRYT